MAKPTTLFNTEWIKTFGWKDRIRLWFRALAGQVCRMKFYDHRGNVSGTGWYDTRKDTLYVTWVYPLYENIGKSNRATDDKS